MAVPPPPVYQPMTTEDGRIDPIWLKWQKDVRDNISDSATLVDSPTVDNFASLDANGNIQDSGADSASFAAASHNHVSSDVTDFDTEVDANIISGAIALLGSATIDTQAGDAKTTVYTVPVGKTAVITHVVIRSPSASLAGGIDFDIGSGANADTWRQTIDLSSMAAVTDYMVVPSISAVPVKYTLEAAGSAFGIKPITGATLDSTATMDVFGYLF